MWQLWRWWELPLLHNTTTSHLYLCLYFYLYLLECVEVVVEEWPPLHNITLCTAATVPSSSGSKSDRQKFFCLYFLLQCICFVCQFHDSQGISENQDLVTGWVNGIWAFSRSPVCLLVGSKSSPSSCSEGPQQRPAVAVKVHSSDRLLALLLVWSSVPFSRPPPVKITSRILDRIYCGARE